MGSSQLMKYCRSCKGKTLHVQPSTSHILHLILSVITAGLWIPVWLLVGMNNTTKSQCTACGRSNGLFGL